MPKNFLTFRQLDTMLMQKAGLNDEQLTPGVRQAYVNNKLMKIYGVLDGINDPFYHRTTAITATADLVFKNDNINVATNVTTLTISTVAVAGYTFKLGDIFTVNLTSNTGTQVANFTAIITATGSPATYSAIGGTAVARTLATNAVSIVILGSLSSLTYDASGVYIKDVVRISDNGGTGATQRLFKPVKDAAVFNQLHRDPFFDSQVCYFVRGDQIIFFKGTSAVAIATTTMEYRGKPALFTDATEDSTIDLPPENNQLLADEVLTEYLSHTKQPIPQDLADRMTQYQKFYESAAANAQKLQSEKGKRG